MRLLTIQPTLYPWRAANRLASFGGLLDSAFDLGRFVPRSEWLPSVDIFENAERMTVRLEAPGLRKEDFDLSLQDDSLTISGERRSGTESEKGENVRRERFSRVVTLPSAVNADAVSATYEDGVLTVTLPKAEEAKPRRIEVNVR